MITLFDKTDSHEYIIGGDWNVVQDINLDRFGSKKDFSPKSREVIHSWMAEEDLVDIWRLRSPDTRRYTYVRKNPYPHGSRLDYFLISSSLCNAIKNTSIGAKVLSDHCPVSIEIVKREEARGRGYFKLNTSHLKNPSFIRQINLIIDKVILDNSISNELDPQTLWEFLKYKVREGAIKFGAEDKKN